MREATVEPSVISYNSGISACTYGEQWQQAFPLRSEMREAKVGPSVISYSSGAVSYTHLRAHETGAYG
eukprot:2544098-Pyramimonas_sp.AAC.1